MECPQRNVLFFDGQMNDGSITHDTRFATDSVVKLEYAAAACICDQAGMK